MPAQVSFTGSTTITAPLSVVFAHLAEPANYLGLQPLLIEVTELERRALPERRESRRFRSVERLKFFGVLAYRNVIITDMIADPDRQRVDCEVHSRPRITVRTAMTLTACDAATAVADTVTITCPRLLRRFVAAEAERAHRTLLANLKARLEGEAH